MAAERAGPAIPLQRYEVAFHKATLEGVPRLRLSGNSCRHCASGRAEFAIIERTLVIKACHPLPALPAPTKIERVHVSKLAV